MKSLKPSLALLGVCQLASTGSAQNKTMPNLVIVMTDEHNFRTLGCYRDLMTSDQAFVWGSNVDVKTPNLDAIGKGGAICTNFYSSSPVSTPSRASFVSGLYPIATGSPQNDMPMHDDVITFAEVLRQKGYSTSYVGKWHLDGEAKPGFAPARKFGFTDNRYMFNRGHWKGIGDDDEGNPFLLGKVDLEKESQQINVREIDPKQFTTDYLTEKTLEIIARDKNKPFCVMLSIPDPHDPNIVRPPYDTMFDNMTFQHPKTMDVAVESLPKWMVGKDVTNVKFNQDNLRKYFGMVKCIDDNVGLILKYLKDNNLEKNTIVVFTSDHGDMMAEHRKYNKGVPYEGSARVPFLIRYPEKIAAGKVISKAFTTTDFGPTILGIMGAGEIPNAHGLNSSKDFLSKTKNISDDRITYMTIGNWVCAFNNRYKLVLSLKDNPWLFDLQKDPNELTNFYNDPAYKEIGALLQKTLLEDLKKYKDPILKKGELQLK